MENQLQRDGEARRPEEPNWDDYGIDEFFAYARAHEGHKRYIVSKNRQEVAIAESANMLNQRIYDEGLIGEEIVGAAKDIYETRQERIDGGNIRFTSHHQELDDKELLREVRGKLVGFYALRSALYVQLENNEESIPMLTGTYTPLTSARLSTSELEFANVHERRLAEDLRNVATGRADIEIFMQALDEPDMNHEDNMLGRLASAGRFIEAMADMDDETPSSKDRLIPIQDELIAYVEYKLGLDTPVNIQANSYNVNTSKYVPSFKPVSEPNDFRGVRAKIGLGGESMRRKLVLSFLWQDKVVWVAQSQVESLDTDD